MPSRNQLGQYFTPPAVVDLAFSILQWLEPAVTTGRLIDPSCGEGAFLVGARQAGFAPHNIYGADADPAMVTAWLPLAQLGCHFAICDGLSGGGKDCFDVVAGNPPFAGLVAMPNTTGLTWGTLAGNGLNIQRLPRELWFLERALQLLRPEGLLALILPEGVLANRRWLAPRQAFLSTAQVEAIIGLPRTTFRASGITVKTCLVVARKQPPQPNHVVRLAELQAEELTAGGATLLTAWTTRQMLGESMPWRLEP